MKFLIDYIGKLLTFGVSESAPRHLNKASVMMNKFTLVTNTAVFISIFLDYYHEFYEIVVLKIFIVLFVIPVSIYFNTYKHKYIGKHFSIFFVNAMIFYLDGYFGKDSGVYYYFFCIIVAVPFVYATSERVSFLITSIGMGFIMMIAAITDHSLFLSNSVPDSIKAELNVNNLIIAIGILLFYAITVVETNAKNEQELLQKQSQLLESEQHLKKVIQKKDNILQVVVHDLRAPLNWIVGTTEVLKLKTQDKEIPDNHQKELEEYTKIVLEACNHGNNIIQELIYNEELNRDLHIFSPVKIRYSDVTAEINSRFKSQFESKNIQFSTSIGSKEIVTDKYILTRILDNLITNSIKFSNENGMIELKTLRNDKQTIIVSDNGIGIPDTLKPIIFEKFTKAKRQGTQGERTIGLGLHITKNLIEKLGGDITFESEEGKGTIFKVTLPFA